MPVFEVSVRQNPVMSLCSVPPQTGLYVKMWNGVLEKDYIGHVRIVSGWNLGFC